MTDSLTIYTWRTMRSLWGINGICHLFPKGTTASQNSEDNVGDITIGTEWEFSGS